MSRHALCAMQQEYGRNRQTFIGLPNVPGHNARDLLRVRSLSSLRHR